MKQEKNEESFLNSNKLFFVWKPELLYQQRTVEYIKNIDQLKINLEYHNREESMKDSVSDVIEQDSIYAEQSNRSFKLEQIPQ